MSLELRVSLTPQRACEIIDDEIINGSITGERIGHYVVNGDRNSICIVSVYEKHYYRVGNRLTLTVICENMSGETQIHSISGGGGEGLFKFDWGASKNFESSVEEALAEYIK